MNVKIQAISKEQAWEIRHVVMWPERELEYIQLKDDDKGLHYGLYSGNKLVSVVSSFEKDAEMQFRKFATLQEEQGKGYGSELLHFLLNEAQKRDVKRIWCNARKEKAPFYQKFGLVETGQCFQRDQKKYMVMEKVFY
ncbi:GNAT family N-acetyltransferase [Domibacillus indicus]|uniref:GNAT family N-acetyltransferase n=1 Tax=Domibacillus indicus TaxID=1437523 RepID=UPI00255A2EC7|nr:GNAT family N-acetyltransferase [Domibacillus indicus]